MATGQASTGRRRLRVVVRGRVQGVGFRRATQREATRLQLTGWVTNQPGGEVVVEAEGPAAAVDALLAWCHRGPRFARVDTVEVVVVAVLDLDPSFTIRR